MELYATTYQRVLNFNCAVESRIFSATYDLVAARSLEIQSGQTVKETTGATEEEKDENLKRKEKQKNNSEAHRQRAREIYIFKLHLLRVDCSRNEECFESAYRELKLTDSSMVRRSFE